MPLTSERDVDLWLNNLKIGIEQGDWFGPSFIKPYIFVTLVTELQRNTVKNLELNENLKSYMERMGLWEALGKTSPKPLRKNNEEGRFLPLHAITSEDAVDVVTKKLLRILKPYCIDHATFVSLDAMLMELLGNCYYHANSDTQFHGFVCCQPWQKLNLLQIAIADGGVGIRETLSANPAISQRLIRENSCEMATEYKVTGKPGKNHCGYGLALTRALIEQNLGNLIIISGKEFFRSAAQNCLQGKINTLWEGTLLILELNLTRPMDSKKIYESWPLPEGYTPEDFIQH